jgi:hypothetical protein
MHVDARYVDGNGFINGMKFVDVPVTVTVVQRPCNKNERITLSFDQI